MEAWQTDTNEIWEEVGFIENWCLATLWYETQTATTKHNTEVWNDRVNTECHHVPLNRWGLIDYWGIGVCFLFRPVPFPTNITPLPAPPRPPAPFQLQITTLSSEVCVAFRLWSVVIQKLSTGSESNEGNCHKGIPPYAPVYFLPPVPPHAIQFCPVYTVL